MHRSSKYLILSIKLLKKYLIYNQMYFMSNILTKQGNSHSHKDTVSKDAGTETKHTKTHAKALSVDDLLGMGSLEVASCKF